MSLVIKCETETWKLLTHMNCYLSNLKFISFSFQLYKYFSFVMHNLTLRKVTKSQRKVCTVS